MRVTETVIIPEEHPAFAGHFPGMPILPGVLLLDEALRVVERDASLAPGPWRIGTAKFLKTVGPGERLQVELESLPNGSVRFSILSAGAPVASGTLLPGLAGETAAVVSKPADTEPRVRAEAWAGIPERGSATALSIGIFIALRLGRRLARQGMRLVAAYYVAFSPGARRSARDYLRRALVREPTLADVYRQMYTFGITLLDRFYLVHARYDLFALTSEGEEAMRERLASGTGAFLLGAHLGSFEMLSAVGKQNPGLRVAMAMHAHQAGRLAAVFTASGNPNPPEIVPLGHVDSMLRIHGCLDEGKFVGMLADRTIGEAPAQVVNFLGTPTLFPSGPMRLAAALRRPVIFMAALYRGGNRYHAIFSQIADFSQPAPEGREAAVRAGIQRYAALLETYCRSDPYNWFNFYDFWASTPAAPGPA
jgi:predicted LPLAT superfamily acyltransferase